MGSLRLTPLNILSGILLAAIGYLLSFADGTGWRQLGTVPLICLLGLSLISDLLFRFTLNNLKRIWIVECLFLIFVLLILFIIRGF